MIVLLIGDTNGGRNNFYRYAWTHGRTDIFWINNAELLDYSAVNLILHFGGRETIPNNNLKSITWSGDHNETLQRVYKTLGLE
jgi:hypothetical protein